MTDAGDPDSWSELEAHTRTIESLPGFRGWILPSGELEPDKPTHTDEPACLRCGDLRPNHEGDQGELECSICQCPGGRYTLEESAASFPGAVHRMRAALTHEARTGCKHCPFETGCVDNCPYGLPPTHTGASGATYEGGLYTGPWIPVSRGALEAGGPIEGASTHEGGLGQGGPHTRAGGLDQGATHQGPTHGQGIDRVGAYALAMSVVEGDLYTPWSEVPTHLQQTLTSALWQIALLPTHTPATHTPAPTYPPQLPPTHTQPRMVNVERSVSDDGSTIAYQWDE